MRAGSLRHTADIQVRSTTNDTYGEPANTWTTYLQGVRLSIEPLTGSEYFAAEAQQGVVTHRIRMRYQAGIEPYHRISFGGRVFDITSVRDVFEKNRELEIYAVEGKPGP